MRIACVNQDAGIAPGRRKGGAVHVAAIQRAFRQLGCEVAAVEEKDGARVERALAELHAARALDLVYERHALGATGAARFARASGVPLYLEVNAPLFEEASAHRGFAPSERDLADERLVLATAEELFPVSTGVADYLARRGVARERLHVTPNGVDLDVFRPRAGVPAGIGRAAGEFVLGFHGRLRPWHNFALLAEAFALLLERGHAVRLLAVGEGEFEAALPPALRARSTIRSWMEPEALAAHVACFDALPLTYAAGAQCYFSPLKLLEAMACGVVPLVPDLGDLPEAVAHGRCGVVYRAGDARALADALAGLIEWPDARGRLAQAARERAATRGWTVVAREILEHFTARAR